MPWHPRQSQAGLKPFIMIPPTELFTWPPGAAMRRTRHLPLGAAGFIYQADGWARALDAT